MTNIERKGCVTHRIKSFRKGFDGYVTYFTLCKKERGNRHNFIVDTPVTCVSCRDRLARIKVAREAIAGRAEDEDLNILLKTSSLVHRVEEHHVGEHTFVIKTICGRWMEERGVWRTPIVVDRSVTCKHCLRVIAAREENSWCLWCGQS